jgi:hypothetical protein
MFNKKRERTMKTSNPNYFPSPLLVRPKEARRLLSCGNERLYQLLNSGALESFPDGRARYITVASIQVYIARRLMESGGTPTANPVALPPGRSGRRKRSGMGIPLHAGGATS